MDFATLGGVPGAGAVRSRRLTQSVREYRGTFAFEARHEVALDQLLRSRDLVEFDGVIDGERKKVKVVLTDLRAENGVVHFEGSGAPY